MILKRIGALSCAKVTAVLYGVIGLIIGFFVSLFSLLISAVGSTFSESSGSWFGALFGIGSIIFFPIFYAALGFIGGLIMAGLYNLVARMVGGIELDLEQQPTIPRP